MNEDKRKALESAGWKFGSADEFLGERPMSDSDKMLDKSDYYLVIGPIEKMLYGYPATDRKEWLEDAGWKDVQIVWADEQNVDYQAAYQAGRKAEQAEVERLERAALDRLRAELRAAKFGRTSRKQKDTTPPPAT